jgi:DNA-binding PadR family transcriptional regulator
MSEVWLLSLVERYPNRTALAQRAHDTSLFAALQGLEARGLLWRKQDRYRLTRRGRDELALARSLIRLPLRGQGRC